VPCASLKNKLLSFAEEGTRMTKERKGKSEIRKMNRRSQFSRDVFPLILTHAHFIITFSNENGAVKSSNVDEDKTQISNSYQLQNVICSELINTLVIISW